MPNTFRIPQSSFGPPTELWFKTDELLTVMTGQMVHLELVVASASQLADLEDESFTVDPPLAAVRILHKRAGVALLEFAAIRSGRLTLRAKVADRPSIIVHIGKHASHFEGGTAESPWVVDLLASRSNGNDLARILAIQNLLHNAKGRANIIDQRTGRFGTTAQYNCADVCLNAGRALFGSVSEKYMPYHVTIPEKVSRGVGVLDRKHITYRDATMEQASKAILGHLAAGRSVRVGTMYDAYASALVGGRFQADHNGGHSVLIVASDGLDQFLYLDPLPGFSRLEYNGGLSYNKNRFACSYMGIFTMTWMEKRGNVLHNAQNNMEVISGPLV